MNDGTPSRACVVTPKRNRSRLVVPEDAQCSYCGAPAAVIDHIYPWSLLTDPEELAESGLINQDDPRNLTPACQPCNASKGSRTLDDWLVGQIIVPYTFDWFDASVRHTPAKMAVHRAILLGRCAPWVSEFVRERCAEMIRRLNFLTEDRS